MFRRLVVAWVVVAPLVLAIAPTTTDAGASIPIHDNTGDAAYCNDLIGSIVFKTPLTDAGGLPGQAVWTATAHDCHSQSAGEYDPEFNPGGVSLQKAVVKGTFDYASNDCGLLDGGPGGAFLGGQLTVHWAARRGTPALAQKQSIVTYPRLAWAWESGWLNLTSQRLHLGLNAPGIVPAPVVTGGFAGDDGGATTRIETVVSESEASLTSPQGLCAGAGVRKITLGIGSVVMA